MKRIALALSALAFMAGIAGPAASFDLKAMTDADRAAFRAEIRAYLMDNPEVIMEAVSLLEEREAEARANADLTLVSDNAAAIFEDGYSYVGGNPEGDITLVEFLDYKCGYCKRAHVDVSKLLEADGNIRLIVKELPILGEQSVIGSRFAIATKQVAGPEAYKAVTDAMLSMNGALSVATLSRVSRTLGLDTDAIVARMDDTAVTAEIAETRALAQRLKITGTPTFVLEDELLRGYLPHDQMAQIIAEKRN